jgi:hypothetical protein
LICGNDTSFPSTKYSEDDSALHTTFTAFSRSSVWFLVVIGPYTTQKSNFEKKLSERTSELGKLAKEIKKKSSRILQCNLQGWRERRIYPIMAGDKEMVSSSSSIPEGIERLDAINIALDKTGDGEHDFGVWNIQIYLHVFDTIGHEKHMRLGWILNNKRVACQHLLDEQSL